VKPPNLDLTSHAHLGFFVLVLHNNRPCHHFVLVVYAFVVLVLVCSVVIID